MLTLAPGRLVNDAAAGCGFVAPSTVVIALAGMLFVRLPLTVMVTLRVNVQFAKAGRLPPLNENDPAPVVALIEPPQVPTFGFAGVAMIMPFGILSVNAIPESATLLGLINFTLMVEAEPPKTVSGSKPFTRSMDKFAAFATDRFAVRLLAGVRFSLFVIFAGGIIFVYVPVVLPVTKTSIRQR